MENNSGTSEIKSLKFKRLKVASLSVFFLYLISTTPAFANSIIKFEGVYKYQAVFFTWELAQNINYQFKEIERSTDSVNFYNCLSFSGNNTKQFAWDKLPLPGKSFYRLKVIDSNGNIEYSAIITIKVKIIIPYHDISKQISNCNALNKAACNSSPRYKLFTYDMNGNIKSNNEITDLVNFNPNDYIRSANVGESFILVVLQDNSIISRQVYYKNEY